MRWGIQPLRVALPMLLLALFAAPASAVGAPPANDFFANRQPLGPGFPGGLPIEVSASNVDATPESGENISPFAAGHSIWFEWEATATDWVSVGVCSTEFPTVLDVFTGTEIDGLTSVLESTASAGPDCPGGDQVKASFRATSGTKYVIVVDGNGFFLPESPKPVTVGPISLQVEETPLPPNDDFADAILLERPIDEEPGGNRFYFVNARGYNWDATREVGEPGEETASGASVWYRWTAPESGTYTFGQPCCSAGIERTVYSGNSIGALTPVSLLTNQAFVAAGTTLYIAVSGKVESGEPEMASFSFFISANLPPLPKPSPGGGGSTPAPDTTPPETAITKSRLSAMTRSAKFWFSSSEPAAGFLCKLDKSPFKPCGSPRGYRKLKPGRHTFKVKAIDAAGNVDPTPATTRIRLPERRPRR
ncbi:MAG TPA: hypothetical protein VFT79_09015 [Solirubrobacterales bacterium]|nr:hypothetical protein [Solirubrobacterales bacterium]